MYMLSQKDAVYCVRFADSVFYRVFCDRMKHPAVLFKTEKSSRNLLTKHKNRSMICRHLRESDRHTACEGSDGERSVK